MIRSWSWGFVIWFAIMAWLAYWYGERRMTP